MAELFSKAARVLVYHRALLAGHKARAIQIDEPGLRLDLLHDLLPSWTGGPHSHKTWRGRPIFPLDCEKCNKVGIRHGAGANLRHPGGGSGTPQRKSADRDGPPRHEPADR